MLDRGGSERYRLHFARHQNYVFRDFLKGVVVADYEDLAEGFSTLR